MSTYAEDLEQLLTIIVKEKWEVRKINTADGLVDDKSRNTVMSLTAEQIAFLEERGYSLEGAGEYELTAPEDSCLLDLFSTPNPKINIFTDEVEA